MNRTDERPPRRLIPEWVRRANANQLPIKVEMRVYSWYAA